MEGLHNYRPQVLGHHGPQVFRDLAEDGYTVNVEKCHLDRLGGVPSFVTPHLFIQGLGLSKGLGGQCLEGDLLQGLHLEVRCGLNAGASYTLNHNN